MTRWPRGEADIEQLLRRNELEYPNIPGDTATIDEAEQAAEHATNLIAAASQLLDQLPLFGRP